MTYQTAEELRGFLRLCLDPGPGYAKRSDEELARIMPDWMAELLTVHAPHLGRLRTQVEGVEASAAEERQRYTEELREWITGETAPVTSAVPAAPATPDTRESITDAAGRLVYEGDTAGGTTSGRYQFTITGVVRQFSKAGRVKLEITNGGNGSTFKPKTGELVWISSNRLFLISPASSAGPVAAPEPLAAVDPATEPVPHPATRHSPAPVQSQYLPTYTRAAAAENIAVHLAARRADARSLDRHIAFLDHLLAHRTAQIAAGTWPPPAPIAYVFNARSVNRSTKHVLAAGDTARTLCDFEATEPMFDGTAESLPLCRTCRQALDELTAVAG